MGDVGAEAIPGATVATTAATAVPSIQQPNPYMGMGRSLPTSIALQGAMPSLQNISLQNRCHTRTLVTMQRRLHPPFNFATLETPFLQYSSDLAAATAAARLSRRPTLTAHLLECAVVRTPRDELEDNNGVLSAEDFWDPRDEEREPDEKEDDLSDLSRSPPLTFAIMRSIHIILIQQAGASASSNTFP